MIAHRLGVTAKKVSVEIHSPSQFRRSCKRKFSVSILDIQIAREHRLSFLDDVHISSASLFGGIHAQSNALARTIDGAFRAQKNLVLAFASLQLNFA